MSAREDYPHARSYMVWADQRDDQPAHLDLAAVFDELDRLRAEVERLSACILDVDAHATPLGEDADGFVSVGYMVSVGAVHRALGAVGHSSAKCRDLDCERAATLRAEVERMRPVIEAAEAFVEADDDYLLKLSVLVGAVRGAHAPVAALDAGEAQT